MITPAQCRAGRALINISQQDLADATGLDRTGIVKFEASDQKGAKQVDTRSSTLEKYYNFFDIKGITPSKNGGMEFKPDNTVTILKGIEGFKAFMHDVREEAHSPDVDICVSGVDETLFDKGHGDLLEHHLATMNKLFKEHGFSFRILVSEGDKHRAAEAYAKYKTVKKENFTPTAIYVYGNKKADIIFRPETVTVIITKSQELADAYRTTFNEVWA